MPLSRNLRTLTSWNHLGHSRPVTGLLKLFYPSKHSLALSSRSCDRFVASSKVILYPVFSDFRKINGFSKVYHFFHLSLRYEKYLCEDEYIGVVTKPKSAQMHKSTLYYKYTYLLTPRRRALLEKITGSQLFKNFPTSYKSRRFITAITRAHQLSLT